jgi:two-component system response regulator YesN
MLREPCSAGDIAQLLRTNPDYLNRTFKDRTGQTLTRYLHLRKLEEAKRLLASGRSVKEAAARTGWPDTKYFARRFKRLTGLTPSQYAEVSGNVYRN